MVDLDLLSFLTMELYEEPEFCNVVSVQYRSTVFGFPRDYRYYPYCPFAYKSRVVLGDPLSPKLRKREISQPGFLDVSR